jgi:hypothetical protein
MKIMRTTTTSTVLINVKPFWWFIIYVRVAAYGVPLYRCRFPDLRGILVHKNDIVIRLGLSIFSREYSL